MVRLILNHHHLGDLFGSIALAMGLFVSVSVLVALCVKHTRHGPKIPEAVTKDGKLVHKSPMASPRRLVATISNKKIPFVSKKKDIDVNREDAEFGAEDVLEEAGFGEEDGGLWQRAILMGEKCQPPEFSGVIYYDYDGNQIAEPPPRSPRASPLPSFKFSVAKDAN